jgi:hypothetical protein
LRPHRPESAKDARAHVGSLAAFLATELTRTYTPIGEIAVRLGLASLLAAALGFDRELLGRSAGLRTHMLVSLAAATFTLGGNRPPNADPAATLADTLDAESDGKGGRHCAFHRPGNLEGPWPQPAPLAAVQTVV